ncbi:protein DMP3-like [Phragmites australis]|uniref:protein DMP3-like n=1 Tax=Phragmites australis TaxID=29695 RepID=UPI002D79E126|nr:protein DMP3-like [Phragmites australis]
MASSSSSSLRQRPVSAQQPQLQEEQQQPSPKQEQQQGAAASASPPPPPSTLSQALTSTANLANLLPTGTLLAFNLLAPTFTNHGACDGTTALLTRGLLAVLALSCVLASFTDSMKGPDGRVYYGVATPRGLWLLDYPPGAPTPGDTSRYRLALVDFVHAALSVAVFGVVAARDKNVVRCFCPAPARETEEVLDILPLGVGVLCSLLFVAFPM